ncbi:hypothetical protein BBP40_000137 [Aspergillus hancockii]|nr:hypothetical protein BBP40_000137 [Aspergillus hancockii]
MVQQRQYIESANQQHRSRSRRENDGATDDGSPGEPPLKRHKRGKYVSKACGQCQRRKVKCDGSFPCQPCVLNGRDCVMQAVDMRRRRTIGLTESGISHTMTSGEADLQNRDKQPTARELAWQLTRIETQLNLVLSSVSHGGDRSIDNESRPNGPSNLRDTTVRRPMNSDISDPVRSQVPAFSGESSIKHTLDQIEGYLEHTGAAYDQPENSMSCRASGKILTAPSSPLGASREMREMADIRRVLTAYGIDTRKDEWDAFMRTFCDEVHILYPFLHIPSLRANYANMWNSSFSSSEHEFQRSMDYRIMVAQVWVCIALGRCTDSPRVSSEEGKHSAGWSLFEATTDLIGDLLGSFRTCSRPILILQTYSLMIVYLFRLDANERAEKFLALAISHAHHLGFHRSKVVERMPAFESEMVRRLWWCLYALDRRLAIETGHPFLIQDMNVDTLYPRNLSDEWLTRHKEDSKTSFEIGRDIELGLSEDPVTPIPYLSATIRYSQVVGKIWEAIYGANMTDIIPSSSVLEYLDQLISRAQQEVQPEFSDNHQPEPPSLERGSPFRWRVKQQMLMRIRWLSLRLLIRKSILQQRASPQEFVTDILETEVTCIRMACKIIQEFKQVPLESTASAFPFLHSLVGATVVALGLIIREPSFKSTYGNLTLHAAVSLENYCRKTWVSGKMIRTIRRLNQITSSVLSASKATASDRRPYASGRQPPSTIQSNESTSRSTIWPTHPLTTHPSQTSSAAIDEYPLNSLTTNPNMQVPLRSTNPLVPPPPIAPSTHPRQTLEGWTVTPTNLVTTDFDFEQTLTGDLIPASQCFGWTIETGPSEIQNNGMSYMEMGWLESLFGTDLGSNAFPPGN